jgi:uncharacterized protein YndB with AHSA1/START domain
MSREIVLAIEVEGSPEDTFRAVTTQDGLAAFWTSDVDAEPRVGAKLRLGFPAAPVDLQMLVTALDADDRVEWECPGPWPNWAGTRVEWSIAGGDQTMVTFVHRGWSDEVPDTELGSVTLVWARVLIALSAYIQSGQSAPALG